MKVPCSDQADSSLTVAFHHCFWVVLDLRGCECKTWALRGLGGVLWSECLYPPQMHVEILIPKGDCISRWDLWKVLKP